MKINRKGLNDEGNSVCFCFMQWKKEKVSLLINKNLE